MLNERGMTADQLRITPAYLAELLKLVDAGTINSSTGKSLLGKIEETGQAPAAIVAAEGLAKISDDGAIRSVCAEVIAESRKEAESYKAGKVTLMGWFVGQVMKKMRGKADPNVARKILEELLK
jgi:aspartyl-tRNA(Asn)/glutamyl-tRNA(Gln) amidotransferase subunit B